MDEKLGRYSLVRRIGKGGMGEVWLAKQTGAHGFEKQVALKRILPQFSSNPHVVNMLVDEARISVLLNHPNVVHVLELGDDNGEYFIAMEYVEGHALSRLLRKLKKGNKRLDVLEACYIAIQLLEGLHAAHVQKDQRGKPAGIIHRDVSPQNVLISLDGVVKVIDFGIARARERLEVTQGGSVKGKLRYMAPEQLSPKLIKGKAIDHRVDVFSAGIVLFEMLANRQRFPGDLEMEIMDAILKEDTPDLVREGLIDRELMDILDTALEKDREQRFKDAATFAGHLRSYLYKRDPGFTAERVARKMRDAFRDDGDTKEDAVDTSASEQHSQLSEGQRIREQRVKELSSSNVSLHGESSADDDTEATRTAFRPSVRAQERQVLRDADPGEPPKQATGAVVRRSSKKRRSNVAPIAAGLLIGLVLLLALGLFLKKRMDANPIANPTTTTTTTTTTTATATATATNPENGTPKSAVGKLLGDNYVEVLVEAEPATTRISLSDQPDPKYVSPARLKMKKGEQAELVFEADGYDTEHKTIVADENTHVKVELHPLPVDLLLHVFPRDAVVTVDGEPAKPGMKVIPGRMVTVKAEHPFAKEPRIVQQVPVPGQSLVIEIKLDEVEQAVKSHISHGTIQISSKPPGATVYVDGQKVKGVTPLAEIVSPGDHRITVHIDGKGEKTFPVVVTDGSVDRVEAVLE